MSWWQKLKQALLPDRCAYCGRVIAHGQTACRVCMNHLPRMQAPLCRHCGRSTELCRCRGHARTFDACICVMRYDGVAKKAVYRLKHEEREDVVAAISQELSAAVRRYDAALPFDMITGIPMTKKEQHSRGYNQSEWLAQEVAKQLDKPCQPLLTKLYETCPQKSLKGLERTGNLLGVFDVVKPVEGQRILLVDDVTTTGSTLNECAKMLKLYGAQTVLAVTFAATVPKKADGVPCASSQQQTR